MSGLRRLTLLLAAALLLFASLPPASASAAPWVQARTWIILDADTGVLLDGHDPDARTAMASLTKVMTALVAAEHGDMSRQVTIVRSDLIGEASAGLRAGQTVSLWTLMHGLLMRSGNDAAMAIARAVGGSPDRDDPRARQRFVDLMNARAAALGLTNTHFKNPHGLDEDGHYSSVHDLAVLTRAALENPTFRIPFGAREYVDGEVAYQHGIKLAERYAGVVGGKTGWTDQAGLCLIAVARRGDRGLVVVLIGSTFARWYDDAEALVDYGWRLPAPGTTPERAAQVFAWWGERLDGPVRDLAARRSWTWGPVTGHVPVAERYQNARGGERIVQYFDKGRMEINDPLAPLNTGWYVTGGRLAWELIAGQRQIGDDRFEQRSPAQVPLAGDPDGAGPTYATLTGLLDAPAQTAGRPVQLRLRSDGSVAADPNTAAYGVVAGQPLDATGRGVASVFQAFLGSQGPVRIDGVIVNEPLYQPALALTGYPITEPYWIRVPVAGYYQDVLVQCFERRCLTYTPGNPEEWRVEMGNVGQHYLRWLEESRRLAHPAARSLF